MPRTRLPPRLSWRWGAWRARMGARTAARLGSANGSGEGGGRGTKTPRPVRVGARWALRPDCLLFTRGGAHLSSRVRPLSERNAPQNAAHFDDSELDLLQIPPLAGQRTSQSARLRGRDQQPRRLQALDLRSEEHTSELQSLMRISY